MFRHLKLKTTLLFFTLLIAVSVSSEGAFAACDLNTVGTHVSGQVTIGPLRAAVTANRDVTTCDVTGISVMRQVVTSATFNQDISGWNLSNATSTFYMFQNASEFNQDISGWDVGNVTTMEGMFGGASKFNQNINTWDVSKVTTMQQMFSTASSFNQNLNGWDVTNVTNMQYMFLSASNFNGNISSWDVSNVTNMVRMFDGTAFNQNIGSWDVSKVTAMWSMFQNASAFNQNLENWDVRSVTSTGLDGILKNSNISNSNYDALLIGWSGNTFLNSGVTMTVGSVKYSVGAAQTARNYLTGTKGWTITDGGSSGNNAPVANAGPDQAVASGASVTLTGAASSDADGDPITYLWSQTSGTTVSLSSSTAAQPTFTAPILNLGDPVSTLTFSLTVNDGTVSSALDTIIISIQAPTNNAPVANAGPDQAVASGASVTLTGAASSDADGDPITYLWSQTSGTTVSLSSSTAAQPTFTAPVIDPANASIILTFSLVVNDGALTSAADTVTITVFPLTANAAFELVREDITTELARNARDQMLYLDRTARSLSASARNRYISSKLSRGLNISTSGPSADWTADLNANNEGLEGAASFGSRKSSSNGRTTRLFFADVNVVKDKTAKDSSHATALVQWEQSPNTNTLVGLFAGIRYGASNLSNSSKISVEQKYFGTQVGGYFVRDLSNGAYMDGYVAASTVNNDYDIKSDYMSASSVFDQPSIAMGVSATGVVDYGYMQVKPSIAATVSKSFSSPIIFFVKTAGGSGNVEAILGIQTREVIDFAPEFVFPLTSPLPSVLHESIIEVTPNVFCERWGGLNSTSSCGQGLKVNLSKKLANKAQLEIGAYGTRQSGVNTNYVQASIALNF